MPYQVIFNSELQIIETINRGTIHFKEFKDSGHMAKKLSDEHGVKKYLFDALSIDPDSPISVLDIVKGYAEAVHCKENRMAILILKFFYGRSNNRNVKKI